MRLLKGKADFWITVGAVLGILALAAILVTLAVFVGKFGAATDANTALTKHSIAVGNRHHKQTSQQDDEIAAILKQHSALLNQIKVLQQQNQALGNQHTADIANESQLLMSNLAADGDLNLLGVYIAESNLANCTNSAAAAKAAGATVVPCPPLPKITSLPTTTTTTTTEPPK